MAGWNNLENKNSLAECAQSCLQAASAGCKFASFRLNSKGQCTGFTSCTLKSDPNEFEVVDMNLPFATVEECPDRDYAPLSCEAAANLFTWAAELNGDHMKISSQDFLQAFETKAFGGDTAMAQKNFEGLDESKDHWLTASEIYQCGGCRRKFEWVEKGCYNDSEVADMFNSIKATADQRNRDLSDERQFEGCLSKSDWTDSRCARECSQGDIGNFLPKDTCHNGCEVKCSKTCSCNVFATVKDCPDYETSPKACAAAADLFTWVAGLSGKDMKIHGKEFVEAFTNAVGGNRTFAKELFADLETSGNNWLNASEIYQCGGCRQKFQWVKDGTYSDSEVAEMFNSIVTNEHQAEIECASKSDWTDGECDYLCSQGHTHPFFTKDKCHQDCSMKCSSTCSCNVFATVKDCPHYDDSPKSCAAAADLFTAVAAMAGREDMKIHGKEFIAAFSKVAGSDTKAEGLFLDLDTSENNWLNADEIFLCPGCQQKFGWVKDGTYNDTDVANMFNSLNPNQRQDTADEATTITETTIPTNVPTTATSEAATKTSDADDMTTITATTVPTNVPTTATSEVATMTSGDSNVNGGRNQDEEEDEDEAPLRDV
jgi:hypothetical protein